MTKSMEDWMKISAERMFTSEERDSFLKFCEGNQKPLNYVTVGCDWKNPGNLVEGLLKTMSKFGLHAYDVSSGDYFNVLISNKELSEKEIEDIKENE